MADGHTGPALENGQQERQALGVEALRRTAWRDRAVRRLRNDQALNLDQQRAFALEHGDDHTAGDTPLAVGQEESGRVVDAGQAPLGHLEQSDLAGRSEPVLDRSEQTERMMPVTVEGQHRVDGVLEDPRAGEITVLGDVAHQHRRHVALLGQAHQPMGAFGDLRDRARR